MLLFHTVFYVVEVEFDSCRSPLTSGLETEVGNMFAVGDRADVGRGFIKGPVCGVAATREI